MVLPVARELGPLGPVFAGRRSRGRGSSGLPLSRKSPARRCGSTCDTADAMRETRNLVVIPTYNERENIEPLVRQILELPGFSVMVVDDQSPDGTGAAAEVLARECPGRVEVLHRTGKRGLGLSYVDGFQLAVKRDVVTTCRSTPFFALTTILLDWSLSKSPGEENLELSRTLVRQQTLRCLHTPSRCGVLSGINHSTCSIS